MKEAQFLTANSRVMRSDQIMGSKMDNQLVMIDLESGNYFSLNAIAAEIWERLVEPIQVLDLCAALHERYVVSEERCLREVLALLGQMYEKNLLRLVVGPEK